MGILRRDEPDQTPEEFWSGREEQYGGKVRYFTFSHFLGNSQSGYKELPGLLFVIDNNLYFEDFEKDSMFGRLMGRKKSYEKTEFSIPLDQLVKKQIVRKAHAIDVIEGRKNGAELLPASGLSILGPSPVYHLMAEDGTSWFFDQVMEQKSFLDSMEIT